jgi:hypothetical protein
MATFQPLPDDEPTVAQPTNRQARTTPRTQAPRDLPRAGVRAGAVVVEGRDGEILTRKRTSTGDIFQIPPELIPADYEYQWCAVSVVGNTEVLIDQNLMMAENGWRPVPAERYPGRFMPVGHKGNIVRGGQMLMERPVALCEEARQEDYAKAVGQMRDRDEALTGGRANLKNSIGQGFEMRRNTNYKGRKTQLSIDPAYDIPAPAHEIVGSSDE